jgi:AcrR family transcriptional regulator
MATTIEKVPSKPRGLTRDKIVLAAVQLMESTGEQKFSLRKLGQQVGCDPMAVLYHFKSKDGLNRAMAEWLTAQLEPVDATQPWALRLRHLANQYRQLALEYPHTFRLMQQFLHTGIADFRLFEMTYRSLHDAGICDGDIPHISLIWYATVYGLAIAEIGGMIRQATPEDLAEVEQLPAGEFPLTKRLIPLYTALDASTTFTLAMDMLHDGIQRRTILGSRPPPSHQR